MCPFVLGMILLVCGMVMVALCFYMAQLPEKALKKTCETMLPKRSRVPANCFASACVSAEPLTQPFSAQKGWLQNYDVCSIAHHCTAPQNERIHFGAMQARFVRCVGMQMQGCGGRRELRLA